ncbi:MAG: ABC transporter permease [Burkholderiales bacterium]
MPFQIVTLWTDRLIFLLLAALIVFIVYVRRHEHLLQPWRKVAHSRAGMAAAVVLALFVSSGLLDSMHYRPRLPSDNPAAAPAYAVEARSVFDLIAGGLRERTEKTYSSPLATQLFSKETVELPDGRKAREFPRLRYGGAHLQDPAVQWAGDVSRRAVAGVGIAVLLWNAILALTTGWLARRQRKGFGEMWRAIWSGGTMVRWREMLVTAGALLLILCPLVVLSAKYHVFGTDKVGQDVFYLTLKSIRTGLVIGTLTTLVMLPFALLLGIMAGYFRGRIDDVIQYVYTTLNSSPAVLLIAAAILMTQAYMGTHPDLFDTVQQRQDMRLLFLCLILGVTSWTGLCRLLRGETLKLREMEYIQAAQAFGVSDFRIITRHLLPNVMHIVLIAIVMDFSGLVLAEAVLSYVGVGVDPTMISFGNMINGARLEMAREPMVWWSLASAFVFMLLLVLTANLFADAVRDAFDPRIASRSATGGAFARLLPGVRGR